MENFIELFIGLLGGGTLVKLLEIFFSRKDKKEDKNDKVLEKLEKLDSELSEMKDRQLSLEQNQTRTELIALMNHYPNESFEILRTAHKYFVDLKGDFTMTSLFAKYLVEHKIEKPNWFNEND